MVCRIAEYYYSLFVFNLTMQARQNTVQLVDFYTVYRLWIAFKNHSIYDGKMGN